MTAPLPGEWFAPGWQYRLLPHYRWAGDTLQTLGGRPIDLNAAERTLLRRIPASPGEGLDGRLLGGTIDADPRPGTGSDDPDIVSGLIRRRVLVPLPPRRAERDGLPVDLVLSPHVDDAALCLGATIAASEWRCVVLTVFSEQAYQTGLRVPLQRLGDVARAEEALASEILGFQSWFAGLEGAQDRHRLPLSSVIGCDPAGALVRSDAAAVGAGLGPCLDAIAAAHRIDRILAPAGIGGHLDHLVVRHAVPAIAMRLGLSPESVVYVEDLPYAARGFAWPAGWAAQDRAPDACPPEAWARKHAALLAYATRLRLAEIAATMAWGRAVGGERLLRPAVQTATVESRAALLAR